MLDILRTRQHAPLGRRILGWASTALVAGLVAWLLAGSVEAAAEKNGHDSASTPRKFPTTTVPDKTRHDYSPNCMESGCHAQLRQTRWVHGPIAVGACQTCHLEDGPAEKHRYKPAREKEARCSFCHPLPEPKRIRHEPFVKLDCPKCHDPHGGENKTFLLEPTLDRLCGRCHDGKEHDGKVVSAGPQKVAFPHEPAAKGECVGCHITHQSDHEHLLVREKKRDLCLGCHRKKIPFVEAIDGQAEGFQLPDPLPQDSTLYVVGPLEKMPNPMPLPADSSAGTVAQLQLVHKPLTEDCSACHASHGSNLPGMVKDDPSKLCRSCHEEIAMRLAAARSLHGPALEDEACSRCHVGHASSFAHLLKEPAGKLCMGCHDKAIRVDDEREVPSIKAQIYGARSVHDPVAKLDCMACHLAHASAEQMLLRARHPETTYASYTDSTYAFCFGCHKKESIQQEFTTLTEFRDGERNMHYLHVHKEKGRTCGCCHAPHDAKWSRLIRDVVPFGPVGWPMPITFEKTATGGSCEVGCHRFLAYDRVNRVNPIPEPPAAPER